MRFPRPGGRPPRVLLPPAAVLLLLPLLTAAPGRAQTECPVEGVPYVFVLFDTSGSLNRSSACSQAQLDAGECSRLCPTGNCYLPLQGDDPASKCFQLKEAFHTVLSGPDDLHLGFATQDQDALRVRAKHWLYEAAGSGPAIPGWGAFPAAGDREVFGLPWTCDTGSGDQEIGCTAASPADLADAWEIGRVRRLAKGGSSAGQTVLVFLRHAGVIYRVRYAPVYPGLAGDAALPVSVRTERCLNPTCSSVTLVGNLTVAFERRAEFLSWDDAPAGSSLDRVEPELGYFPQATAADGAVGASACTWDPNDDTAQDPWSGYNLRWPTVADPLGRGTLFASGDVLPPDWTTTRRDEILARLAPNLATGASVPDFRTSPYFEDRPFAGNTYLRLKTIPQRPLVCVGASTLEGAVGSFRDWFHFWGGLVDLSDPDYSCRRFYLVVVTDGGSGCFDPCAAVNDLRFGGVHTYVVGFAGDGTPAFQNQLDCMAYNGGTGAPYLPQSRGELNEALEEIFTEIRAGGPPPEP